MSDSTLSFITQLYVALFSKHQNPDGTYLFSLCSLSLQISDFKMNETWLVLVKMTTTHHPSPIIAHQKYSKEISIEMAWGSGGFKSCDSLLARVENNDPLLTELVILPMKTFGEMELKRLSDILSTGKNTHLTSISASGHAVPPETLYKLSQALASPGGKNIKCLAIGDEQMGDEGVEALCRGLVHVNGGFLESLDLSSKNLTSVSMTYLARTFGRSQYLKSLHLYRNSICDEGLANFKQEVMRNGRIESFPPLELLDLSESNIGALGVASLASCLSNETYVHDSAMELILNNNPNIGSVGCRSLKHLIATPNCASIIRKLSIRKCKIGDEGVIHLGSAFEMRSCKKLCCLDLVDNNIGPRGMEKFATALMDHKMHIEDLNHLNLAENALGSEGVSSLGRSLKSKENEDGNHSIHTIDLSQTNCGPESAAMLLKCNSLKSLRLFNNNLREGLGMLAEYLHGGHATLAHLDVAGNRASGTTISSLLKAVLVKSDPDNSVLHTLELGGNEIDEDASVIIQKLEVARPGLDIARDRPSTSENNNK